MQETRSYPEVTIDTVYGAVKASMLEDCLHLRDFNRSLSVNRVAIDLYMDLILDEGKWIIRHFRAQKHSGEPGRRSASRSAYKKLWIELPSAVNAWAAENPEVVENMLEAAESVYKHNRRVGLTQEIDSMEKERDRINDRIQAYTRGCVIWNDGR